jgi:hypothetical protein
MADSDLLLLAASCVATLPHDPITRIASALPLLKRNEGAAAFLSGTHVPRQMDVLFIEHLLATASKRAAIPFFSGSMPGLGCPGCSGRSSDARGRTGRRSLCVLHSLPRTIFASQREQTRPRRGLRSLSE